MREGVVERENHRGLGRCRVGEPQRFVVSKWRNEIAPEGVADVEGREERVRADRVRGGEVVVWTSSRTFPFPVPFSSSSAPTLSSFALTIASFPRP